MVEYNHNPSPTPTHREGCDHVHVQLRPGSIVAAEPRAGLHRRRHARIESGLTDAELACEFARAELDDISLEVDYEILNIVFLPHQKATFDDVIQRIDDDADVLPTALECWEPFRKAMRAVGRQEKIRSPSMQVDRLAELALERLEQLAKEGAEHGATDKTG